MSLLMGGAECITSFSFDSLFLRHYRREVLQTLKKDLKPELQFAEEIVLSEPKNYQVW